MKPPKSAGASAHTGSSACVAFAPPRRPGRLRPGSSNALQRALNPTPQLPEEN